jgi:hypothetical protein
MATIRRHPFLPSILLAACLATAAAQAEPGSKPAGWEVEQGVDIPSYAVVEPTSTNLNIDTIVLACEEAGHDRILQLQLYLTDEGPLLPKGPSAGPPKDDPRAEMLIDGHVFPVSLLFADTYVVLADAQDGPFPMLSDRLVAALQAGKTMTLRFDLLAEPPSQPARFDGEAVVDLQGGGGPQAIAAVRRCASQTRALGVAAAQLRH